MKINKKILLTSLGIGLGITGLVTIPIVSTSCSSQENVYDNFWAKIYAFSTYYQQICAKIYNMQPDQLESNLNNILNTPIDPNNAETWANSLSSTSLNISYDELKKELSNWKDNGISPPFIQSYTPGKSKLVSCKFDSTNNTITLNFDSNIISINQAINAYVEYEKMFLELSPGPDSQTSYDYYINQTKQLAKYIPTYTNNSIVIDYQAIQTDPPKIGPPSVYNFK